MSVGKGSIQRAAQAKSAAEEKEVGAKTPEVKAEEKKAAPKNTGKKTAAQTKKEAVKKDTPVVAASVISSDDIHEKKFEAISGIYCELPTYLL